MARDPLRVLLSVRAHAVEQARLALMVCNSVETEAMDRIRRHDETMRRDLETEAVWEDAHQFREMTVSRLGAMREARRSLEAELAKAKQRSGEARASVGAARMAAEAVEDLIKERVDASLIEANKREQHGMDDIARARHAVRRPG